MAKFHPEPGDWEVLRFGVNITGACQGITISRSFPSGSSRIEVEMLEETGERVIISDPIEVRLKGHVLYKTDGH